jgi:uncharacterized protein with ParB-like and HNH nuclease domain
MKISTILDKIDEKQLYVPAFQREYVWKRDDAKSLIESLIKEYPTGTMLTWETSNPPELKGPYLYDEKMGSVRILLDGQQRITSLYMLIRGDIPPYYTAPEITNDTRGLYVNVESLELAYYQKNRMQNDPLWQDITQIFQQKVRAKDIIRDLESRGQTVSRERDDKIDDNVLAIRNILDREFPEQTIPVKANVREAINIFYKVNASGVSLTEAELALAQISGYWPQAREVFKRKLAALEKNGYSFKLDFIVYALVGCLYHMASDLRKLHGSENDEKIRQAWERLDKDIFDLTINILRSRAYVDHTSEINSVYALIPIIVYLFDHGTSSLDDEQIRKIIKWFYYSQIRGRYSSQLPQKLDFDLRIVAESHQVFDELLNVISEDNRLEIIPEEFVGRTISNPLFSLMRWYMKSKNAICLTTGVGLHRNMGKSYQLENDHIFPYAILQKYGYGKDHRLKYQLAQEMTNRAVLTQKGNRSKSDTAAADYLTGVRHTFPSALKLQCIPDDESLWDISRFEDFLSARRKILAMELSKFLDNLTVTEDVPVPLQLEELIISGESEVLEFKSSLRWDYKLGKTNKKLEEVVVKTIAAFTNSNGGTLLIGVDDSGKVLGLENDYSWLLGDKDEFELHLRNLMNKAFGITFAAKKLKINFPTIEGQEICQIEIQPADKPIIIKAVDANGQPVEKFYIRSGNSSIELPASQIVDYVNNKNK